MDNQFRKNAHAVIIGINKYQDQKIPDLEFARADAEGVYQILTDPELGRISPENVTLLMDEEATQRNIRSAIGTKLPRRAGEQDMVYIYYAGHGSPLMDPKSRSRDGMEKYLVPTDAELDDLRATGISMDEIQKFFGWIESKQVMFFIDACYSGEAGGRTFQNPLHKGRNVLTAEFLEDLAGEGRLVVTACDVNEVSLETPEMGHGLFTHYLIEGLKGLADKDQDGSVTVHELYEYVYENVSQHARKMGGGMHPIQKGSVKGKIFLTQYETAAQKQAKPLHAQAQAYYNAGKFDEAYELWQQVIKLVPDHAGAKQGLADVENWLKEKERKRQELLERKQRVLLNLYRDGQLPSEEFDAAMMLLENSEDTLTAHDREIRRLLDELTDKKISAASYVKSARLLRKPTEPEPAPKAEKAPKIEPKKMPEVKQVVSKQEPLREKAKPVAATPEPKKIVGKVLRAARRHKRIMAGSAAFVVIGLLIIVLYLQREEQVSEAFQQRTALSDEQVKSMLVEKNFYDKNENPDGKGITHDYIEQTLNGDKVVLDKATGLMWQESGSPDRLTYAKAEKFVRDLNKQHFAGFTDWRLPTLEEAMSLMEPKKYGDLYIDPVFDKTQRWIWTADKYSAGAAWGVVFYSGYCLHFGLFYGYGVVRAVR